MRDMYRGDFLRVDECALIEQAKEMLSAANHLITQRTIKEREQGIGELQIIRGILESANTLLSRLVA